MNKFLFKKGIDPQQKKNLWGAFKVALKAWGTTKKDFEIVIREPKNEGALRTYWMLIDIIVKWSFDEGNLFDKKQWDYYFKMKAGHSEQMNSEFVPRSIANDSNCTWEDMKRLINYIIAYGKDPDHIIVGLEITSKQEQEFINYYK